MVSRDAQFMEDTFDSGKRTQVGSKAVEFRDEDEVTDDEDDNRDGDYNDQDMGEQPAEPVSTHEQPPEPVPTRWVPRCVRSRGGPVLRIPPTVVPWSARPPPGPT